MRIAASIALNDESLVTQSYHYVGIELLEQVKIWRDHLQRTCREKLDQKFGKK